MLLQDLGVGNLGPVKEIGVVPETIDMTVLTGKKYRPAGAAYGVGHIGPVKYHPLFPDPVKFRRFNQIAAINAHGIFGMIIRHDKNDVRSGFGIVAGLLFRLAAR
jgi:hypothetical protein